MPKSQLEMSKKSSVPGPIIPENTENQQKISENQKLLTVASILPADQDGEFFFISGVAFPTRESALKRIEKFQKEQKNCFIGTAAYSRKEEKIQFSRRLTGFSLNFNSKVLFDSSQALLSFLPEGVVCPDDKGCVYISWLFDREYKVEDTDALFSELKEIFSGRATVTPRIPWNSYSRKEKFPDEVSLEQFKKGLGRALDKLMESKGLKKPANMALEAPENLVDARNDSWDASMAVEEIEGTDEQREEAVGLEETAVGVNMETEQEMGDTKPEEENDKLSVLDWARKHLPNEVDGDFYCHATIKHPGDRGEKGPFNSLFVNSLEELVDVSLEITKDPDTDVFFGVNTFSEKRRLAKLAARTKVIANDFDVVKATDKDQQATGKSPTYEKAFSQALGLHKMLGVKPSIVASGQGVHSYIVLDKPYSSSEVLPVAEKLKMLALANKFKIDPVVTADMARVLRLPGTMHRKTTTPLPVLAQQLGNPISLEALTEKVDELLRQEGVGYEELASSKGDGVGEGVDDVTRNLMGYTPVVIAENRGAISSAVDFLIEQGVMDKDYPSWWGVVKDLRGACDVDVCTDDDEQFLYGKARRFSEASQFWQDKPEKAETDFEAKWADTGITNGRIKNLFTLAQGLGWKNPGADGVAGACGGGDDTREVIKLLAGEMHANVTNILKVLATKEIYRVGAALYATKMNDEKIIEPSKLLRKENLGTEVSRHALLMKWSQQKKKFVPTDMPDNVAKAIISEEEYPAIRAMLGVARQPFIRRDGSLVNMAGYDENSNIYCAFNPESYNINPNPSRAEGEAAIKRIQALFEESPLASEADRAAVVSMCLTAAVRKALPAAPGCLHTSNLAGSGAGKNYAEKIIERFCMSGKLTPMPYKAKKEEQDKALFAKLRVLPDCIRYDELAEGAQIEGSPLLLNMLTEPDISDRVLGGSITANVSTRVLLQMSGNAIGVRGDLRRRLLVVLYNPPGDRIFRKDPFMDIEKNRRAYVSDALTAVLAFIRNNPATKNDVISGYKHWDYWCRQSVIWYGLSDPATSLLDNVSNSEGGTGDDETVDKVLVWLEKKFTGTHFEAKEVFKELGTSFEINEPLRTLSKHHREAAWDSRGVGVALSNIRNMPVNGRVLRRAERSDKRNVPK